MRGTKGFTLAEAMVGMLILGVIVAGALSFFVLWSSRSAESFRYKAADEDSATAIELLTSDIRKAGFGVTNNPEYAIFVVNNGTSTADELYISYGDYLNFEADVRAPTADTYSVPYRSINSVFLTKRTFTVDSVALSTQTLITLAAVDEFSLLGIPEVKGAAHHGGIGAVIAAGGTAAVDVDINTTTYAGGKLTGTQDWTFPLADTGKDSSGTSATLAVGNAVVPAISYKLIASTSTKMGGGLWRNRGLEANPYGTAIMGGTPYVDVTNFQVRCQFSDNTWDTTNSTPANLRLVEVIISYRVMISKDTTVKTNQTILGWGPVVQKRLVVSPRSVAFASML